MKMYWVEFWLLCSTVTLGVCLLIIILLKVATMLDGPSSSGDRLEQYFMYAFLILSVIISFLLTAMWRWKTGAVLENSSVSGEDSPERGSPDDV